MFALILFGLLASSMAMPPHRPWHRPPPPRDDPDFGDYNIGASLFDTSRFWEELTREMMNFDRILEDFHRRFPNGIEREGIEGDEYKITIPLQGFKANEIVVKARAGVLMIQAVHKSEDSSEESDNRSYLGIRNLPAYVNPNGTWEYEEGSLKIAFPLINRPVTHEVTEAPMTTAGPDQSREEMEPHQGGSDKDADVGLSEPIGDKDREIMTNEVPSPDDNRSRVEATTYAVDLKNEYEFVPVAY